ncbi:MAG: signal recognition particle-docking protein FtsY, partial [Bdellovibrio sp.]
IQKLLILPPLTSASGKGPAVDLQEQLEEVLYTSDLGSRTVEYLLQDLKWDLSLEPGSLLQSLQSQLKEKMLAEFQNLDSTPPPALEKPRIIMVVGVNGAGKTTSIGKLAHHYHQQNLRVLVAAGDTFRAAAGEQLKTWSERAQVEIFWPPGTQDPSGVAFQATQNAVRESFDVALIDTAGRLHTQAHLMEELKKVKRSIAKALPGAPHEILLVLDANSGQNALIQAENFHSALQISGVLLTKLDGSAKGGVVLGLAHQLQLPVRWVGLGEGIEDLQTFSATEYVQSLFEAHQAR